MTKTKLYKDPTRAQQPTYKPYVPAYRIKGLDPTQIASGSVLNATSQLTKHAPIVSHDNPRIRPAPTVRANVPFADAETSAQPHWKGPMPNIGNNMEASWVGFDDVFVDENTSETLDPNQVMIDNNDDDAENYKDIPLTIKAVPQAINEAYSVSAIDEDEEDVIADEVVANKKTFLTIQDDEYVVVIANSIIKVGTLEEVTDEVKLLIFGEHQLNKQYNIDQDDIVVLKRVKIKVGVFLE